MDYTQIKLGELLSSENETIKRNAISILKTLQKTLGITCSHYQCNKKVVKDSDVCHNHTYCYCGASELDYKHYNGDCKNPN